MEIRRESVSFPPASGSGPLTSSFTEVFPRQVVSATAGLAGFSSGYANQANRPFGELEIQVGTAIESNVVHVDVQYGLRDWSGTFDDAYIGLIDIVILAELEPASAGAFREDLQITGLEFNQATQSFRSAEHLNAAHVQPDNSIPLVAGKPTGVRVYVDYDADSGLPAIAALSGELEMSTATETVTLTPIESIAPRRDSQINRAVFGHTLNFVVDADHCRGEVEFRCHVFDEADPLQKSQTFKETQRFIDFPPVRLFVVGIHYTGQDKNLAAPTLEQFLPSLSFMERVYPTPDVVTTGYAVLKNFDKDVVDGLTEANKLIRDLKGDSEDVYYGVFPNGVTLGDFQGQQSHGVASGLAEQVTVAHEIGHVFGRWHAPCVVPSACDNPLDVDDEYPQYGNFAAHSIGEFGFDPLQSNTGDIVQSPADRFDFMSYARINRWISPYTYVGLMDPGGPVSGGIAAATTAGRSGVWQPTKRMVLFLDMTIDQMRRVDRRPSFHFPAFVSERRGKPSPFRAEFWDECHNRLACHRLYEDPANCVRDCCSYLFFSRLPLPRGAHWIVIFEGRKKIYEECIPDPPDMSIDCNYDSTQDRFTVNWLAQSPGIDEDDIWYVVQWQDVDGSWRGLTPRTREHSVIITPEIFGRRREIRVRVLATSGIATAMIECSLTLPRPRSLAGSVSIVANADGSATAYLTDRAGRSLPNPSFVWHDESGRQIGRGRRLDARARARSGSVRVVAANYICQIGADSHADLVTGDPGYRRPVEC